MKKLFAAALVLFLVCVTSFAVADFNVYPGGGLVIEVNHELDLVAFVDGAGNEWNFFGAEDWFVGDLVSCLIWDNDTPEIYDDEILDVAYIGYIEQFE